ncbi:MAG: pre-peptidase C-terminal domain-containing protein [Acidobacteria bacterium]|nr:pre-peptidase C-terminal domain-containing protein [Acidobacteriota bacterium]
MKTIFCKSRSLISLAFVVACLALFATGAFAGGPLLLGQNGQPVLWPRTAVQGGALNSQTVDAQGRVLYHVDSGPLGPIAHDRAVALIDRIFNLYSNVPTSTLKFVNAGPIKDPNTGQDIDVTKANIGRVTSRTSPSFQNPIIFDSDGSITGSGGVLGFFSFLQLDFDNNAIKEGFVVLNGAAVSRIGGEIPFLGVFTHEIGHLAGPLDHAQVNGAIASGSTSSVQPADFTRAQTFDLFTPFVETLYPFIFSSTNPSSQLVSNGFTSSGFFVASLDFDTQSALSSLYPTPEFTSTLGSIEGRVVIRTAGGDIPISGVNVVARRINKGAYPPAITSAAFPGFPTTAIQLDSDGVPIIPPAQDNTDSLATAASAVTGLQFGSGAYKLQGLPEGQYLVEIQQINPSAVGGSGIGPLDKQIPLPVLEEYYNGPNESSNTVSTFVPVTVTAGNTTSGINIFLNGLSTSALTAVNESEPNEKSRKGQRVTVPVEITGAAAATDTSIFRMTLPDGSTDAIEDFYSFTVPADKIYYILLEPINGTNGDLDMYLFNAELVTKKRGVYNDASVIGSSTSPTANEVVATRLFAGTYSIGISAFGDSSVSYKLRIIPAQ